MDPPTQSGQSHGQQQQHQQPVYNINAGGHYGASAALSAQGYRPVPELYTGAWANVNQGLHGNYRDILTTYWQQTINHLESDTHDYKLHQLPLARIKKVMKADPEVKMISAEAPILFAKGCDIFITELTMRAWIHAEENKRRTLQRSDIASALAKSDMFDFLIDIVPREESAPHAKRSTGQPSAGGAAAPGHMPGQPGNVVQHQQNVHAAAQHQMGPQDYASLEQHSMPSEQEYRQQPSMFGGAVQPGPAGAYSQHQQQLYNIGGIYGYAPMPSQQMYQVSQQGQDPSANQDASHHFGRHDGGDGDADAEGDRDYEV